MTDLTDRMRTCAAYLCGAEKAGDGGLRDFGRAIIDAADLLIEASNVLESYEPQPEPMEFMKPWVENPLPAPPVVGTDRSIGTWIAPGGPLPGLLRSSTISPRACPRCDSRVVKRVGRQGTHLMLVCPVCAHVWPYMKKPPAEGTAGGKS